MDGIDESHAWAIAADALVVDHRDVVLPLGMRRRPTRGDPERAELIFAVLHRSSAPWTHVYAVVRSARPHLRLVHLLRVFPGARLPEATRWVRLTCFR